MSNASDFIIEDGVLVQYIGFGEMVAIPDGVAIIGEKAFHGCTSLTGLTIPESITDISGGAFSGCVNLRDVTIPNSVTAIGEFAFHGCTSLLSVHLPNRITAIRDFTFLNCRSLKAVFLPDGITSIGAAAFEGCTNLTNLKIPVGVKSIGYNAFSCCTSMTGFYVDENNEYFTSNDCGILLSKDKKIIVQMPGEISGTYLIPNSVTTIGDAAFGGCSNLNEVIIPRSVTTIGWTAFRDCTELSAVTFEGNITNLPKDIFKGCNNLKKLKMPIQAGTFVGKMIEFSNDLRIDIPDLFVLPVKYRICAALCFAEDGGLNTDSRFESHSKYFRTNSGKLVETAAQNHNLLSLLCREGWIKAKEIELYVAAVQKTGDAQKIAMILEYQNSKLTKSQKESMEKQKEKQEDAIREKTVDRANAEGISGLRFVLAGDLVTYENRKKLKEFIEDKGGKLLGTMSAKTDYLIMNESSFDNEKKKQSEALGIEIITERQFNDKAGRRFLLDEDGGITKYLGASETVIIPDGSSRIGGAAFYECTFLNHVTIPNSVTSISRWAFYGCKNITCLDIPGSVTTIGERAFYNCTSLRDLHIAHGVKSIGNLAFSYCSSLTHLTIPDSVILIGNSAFCDCKNLSEVTIGSGIVNLENSCFENCGNLSSVTIPKTVTKIGWKAFAKCPNLTIHAPAGSYAENYAKEHNIPFVAE